MKKQIKDFVIIQNQRVSPDSFMLRLRCFDPLEEIKPGQFVEILVNNSQSTFLRRPFSIHDVDYKENIISVYIKIVGDGTRQLAYSEEGDYLNLVYPLGNGFEILENKKVLLVGGGCGIAPLLYLSKKLNEANNEVDFAFGGKSHDDIFSIEEFEQEGCVSISTEDGSFGEKGYVTQSQLMYQLEEYDAVYTCGPEPMMKALAKLAAEAKVECYVSLENTMACGIGACLCCVTETTKGNKCVCTEGPVFNTKDLKW
ncbi:MAG TPA: dihydroorotate dehydrogenase electron transfer subunit [Bacteroidales bacterium]|nr:MAG: diguanylate cyclase [Bacteroidetes bacterium GWF2_33_38]OFY73292.1 MAG: diguanylate cyclase [Bacteroidetes bacterium RIFOXYA12_FULL_33_9]OFY89030.1 MAG: diguanylate cyclase [Bacteroidetes bacterium RIFOXYA2_FULL_33_7]HBF88697.1 dihydroorotate dehydrogenase electron transfer subunit [Bacteroidales bacterium]